MGAETITAAQIGLLYTLVRDGAGLLSPAPAPSTQRCSCECVFNSNITDPCHGLVELLGQQLGAGYGLARVLASVSILLVVALCWLCSCAGCFLLGRKSVGGGVSEASEVRRQAVVVELEEVVPATPATRRR